MYALQKRINILLPYYTFSMKYAEKDIQESFVPPQKRNIFTRWGTMQRSCVLLFGMGKRCNNHLNTGGTVLIEGWVYDVITIDQHISWKVPPTLAPSFHPPPSPSPPTQTHTDIRTNKPSILGFNPDREAEAITWLTKGNQVGSLTPSSPHPTPCPRERKWYVRKLATCI